MSIVRFKSLTNSRRLSNLHQHRRNRNRNCSSNGIPRWIRNPISSRSTITTLQWRNCLCWERIHPVYLGWIPQLKFILVAYLMSMSKTISFQVPMPHQLHQILRNYDCSWRNTRTQQEIRIRRNRQWFRLRLSCRNILRCSNHSDSKNRPIVRRRCSHLQRWKHACEAEWIPVGTIHRSLKRCENIRRTISP